MAQARPGIQPAAPSLLSCGLGKVGPWVPEGPGAHPVVGRVSAALLADGVWGGASRRRKRGQVRRETDRETDGDLETLEQQDREGGSPT